MALHLLTETLPLIRQSVTKSIRSVDNCIRRTWIYRGRGWTERESVSRCTDLLQELLERHLSLSDEQHVLDDDLVLLEVNVPELAKGEVGQDPADVQALHQLFPVPLFHRLRLQLDHQHVYFGVRRDRILNMLV